MRHINELKFASELEKILLIKSRDAIRQIDPLAEIILYGSRARGNAEIESDYDLLVLTEGEVTLEREDMLRRQLFPMELETGAVLTVILISKKDWGSPLYDAMPFYQNIRRDGVML